MTPLLAASLTFATGKPAEAGPANFSFVQIGDTQLDGSELPTSHAKAFHDRLREIEALAPNPSFVIETGNLTEDGAANEFSSFRRLVSTDLIKSIPLYVTAGDRDVRTGAPARDAFAQEAAQPRFQSWDHEGVHFILLDSTTPMESLGHFDQEQMAWLMEDLKKTGPQIPIIVAFHHAIGQPSATIDNEDALLTTLSPYNVRLFLTGHDRGDLLSNVNGVPAVMTGALYDGSYSIVRIHDNLLDVYRRTPDDLVPAKPLLTVPLQRPASPHLSAKASTVSAKPGAFGNDLLISVDRGDLPKEAVLSYTFDGGPSAPLDPVETFPSSPNDMAWSGRTPLSGGVSGDHHVVVFATYPDGRVYRLPITLSLLSAAAVRPRWMIDLGSGIQGDSVSDGTTVYVPTIGGTVYALDTKTGTMRWRYANPGTVLGAPTLDNNMLYFASGDGIVTAVDRATGGPQWKSAIGSPVIASVVKAGNVLCVAATDGSVSGLDISNGHDIWKTVAGEGTHPSRPATDGSHLFLGDWGNNFRCLDATNGQEIWKVKIGTTPNESPSAAPTMNADNTVVYVASNDGTLHALDAKTGAELWKTPYPDSGESAPLFTDGALYEASKSDSGTVACFDPATGAKQWESPVNSAIWSSGLRAGSGDLYVGSLDGTISAMRIGDGGLEWQYRLPPGHLLVSPTVDDDQVYVGSLSGTFMAFPLHRAAPPVQ